MLVREHASAIDCVITKWVASRVCLNFRVTGSSSLLKNLESSAFFLLLQISGRLRSECVRLLATLLRVVSGTRGYAASSLGMRIRL